MSQFITNAELRIEAERLCDDNEHLREENAKLRELCEGMLVCYEPCNEHLDARTECPLYDENEPLRCRKARLLRELGIGS